LVRGGGGRRRASAVVMLLSPLRAALGLPGKGRVPRHLRRRSRAAPPPPPPAGEPGEKGESVGRASVDPRGGDGAAKPRSSRGAGESDGRRRAPGGVGVRGGGQAVRGPVRVCGAACDRLGGSREHEGPGRVVKRARVRGFAMHRESFAGTRC